MWTPQDAAKHQKTKDSSTPLATKATATPTPHYKLNMRPMPSFIPSPSAPRLVTTTSSDYLKDWKTPLGEEEEGEAARHLFLAGASRN